MGASCVYRPKVKVGNETRDSELFKSLLDETGDYQFSKAIWGISQVREWRMRHKGLEYDANGEPTLESLERELDVASFADGALQVRMAEREVGAVGRDGRRVRFRTSGEAVDRAVDYNTRHADVVADVVRSDVGYEIQVERSGVENAGTTGTLVFGRSLSNQIRETLRSLGFDVGVMDDPRFAGLFDPHDMERTAEGLRVAIRVMRGELGEDALPEEYAHMMIWGLRSNTLVDRLVRQCGDEAVMRAALGSEYDTYMRIYGGDMGRMALETAGRLLADSVVRGGVPERARDTVPLLRRVWEFVKSLFGRVEPSSVSRMLENARASASLVAEGLRDRSILSDFDASSLGEGADMYSVTAAAAKRAKDEIWSLRELAQRALENHARKMRVMRDKVRWGDSAFTAGDEAAFREMEALMEREEDFEGCMAFLEATYDSMTSLSREKAALDNALRASGMELRNADLGTLSKYFNVLNNMRVFVEGYDDIISKMWNAASNGRFGLDAEQRESMLQLCSELRGVWDSFRGAVRSAQYDALYGFLSHFWQGDFRSDFGDEKQTLITLDMVMSQGVRDVGFFERMFGCMASCSSGLLSLFDRVTNEQFAKRDREGRKWVAKARAAQERFEASGGNTDFMFERDADGRLTGRLVSDRDFAEYIRRRNALLDSMRGEGLDIYEAQERLDAWEAENLEEVVVDEETGRTELMPAKSIYGKEDPTLSMSEAQREYYREMMRLKSKMDGKLPKGTAQLYLAVQTRNDMFEDLTRNAGRPGGLARAMGRRLKEKFMRNSDDVDYGMDRDSAADRERREERRARRARERSGERGTEYVVDWETGEVVERRVEGMEAEGEYGYVAGMSDMDGAVFKQVPIFYTAELPDMERLSTDMGSSMLAYIAMACNYEYMNEIVDVMEVARDYVDGMQVEARRGCDKIIDTFRVMGRNFSRTMTTRGERTNLSKMFNRYLDKALYGLHKRDAGRVRVFGKRTDLDSAKLMDAFRSYCSKLGLGYNPFAASANMVRGDFQAFVEAIGGRHYGLRDLLKAKATYWREVPGMLADMGDANPDSKLLLVMEEMNAMQDWMESQRMRGVYNNRIKRIIGNQTFYVLTHLGEHNIRASHMLAVMNRTKVRNAAGEEVSLWDALKVVTDGDGSRRVAFEEGTTDADGRLLSTEGMDASDERHADARRAGEGFLDKVRLEVRRVVNQNDGTFNEMEKGEVNHYALGRFLMLFKQWMPEYFNRRWAGVRYNAAEGGNTEGFHHTLCRIVFKCCRDLVNGRFEYETLKGSLSEAERSNIRKSLTEIVMFAVLSIALGLWPDKDDKDNPEPVKFASYMLQRMRMDTGLFIPWYTMGVNLIGILQDPMAGSDTMLNAFKLLAFWQAFDEVRSGRYKGWNQYALNCLKACPAAPQMMRVLDFGASDSMFEMFKRM